ncbi:MAG TPA: amino acid adenylation domain-containing protein, partial [Longimicrobium sp.]|nr:amino acid adenylation domain-containing protein [Longimicrobium sp.]
AAEASAGDAPVFPPILPVARGVDLPPSFSQERVWFLTQLAPENLSYHAHAALVFRGALDVAALEAALTAVVARHEILRTTFPTVDGRPVQRIHAPWTVSLPVIDFSGTPAEAREDAVRAWMRQDFSQRFDLAALPLLRWTLLRMDDGEHRLVHVEHHIIHDGWSFNVLLRDLMEAYGAAVHGRGAGLAPLELQFGDFCAWQREWMKSDAAREQLAYWRQALAGSPPVLELPTDRPRPAVQRFRGAAPRFHLDGGLYRDLRALGHAEGATLYMAMLAAFDVLMARWSGQDDVSVGTGIAVRRQHETEEMMGMFVNSLVLRTDLSGEPTFRELLARVRRATLDAYARQDVPFEAVVDAVRPDRTLAHNPLFQVMLSFHDSVQPELALPGVDVELNVALSNQSAKFDLNIVAIPHAEQRGRRAGDEAEGDEGITLVWEHDSDLFDLSTMERMFRHYRALLRAAVADPDTPVSRLDMLGDDEAGALLAAGRAVRAFPVAERIHERFERRAAERPAAPAVSFEGATLTYGELNARANRLAHRLRALGVGPETRVGLCLERSAELVVAILAVLKAGGGYVPLDPSYPADRIAFVLEDAGAPVLVTHSRLLANLPAHGGETLCVDRDADAIARESDENPAVAAGTEALAYVIYTSGSTGRPKGVQVTHANVARLFDATDAWFGFGADDVWTLFHSFAFDFSVWELWGALLYGGRLVVVPFLTTRSPEDFHRLLVDEGVTVLNQTPSAFRQLIQADLAADAGPAALRLRHVVFGGEALDPQALRPWFDRHGDARPRLVNMYGITETTVHVTFREITRADLERTGSPIGVPIPDLSLYVLDRHLRPVPAGVAGELFVGGAGVARGYLNRAELTAERFIRDPFSDDADARLYRSGDLARRRADGELEYLGRADQQVKVRGFRIETGEIEAALASHPAVATSAVVVREDAPGDRRLVAYVVAAAGCDAPASIDLRAHVAATLPDYMVPAAFVAMDALPLTGNGKLDRRALPAPEGADGAHAAEAYTAPSTPAQAALAEVWQEVLGVERVGIDDNYFALGGDSIRSVRVVAAARRRGVELSIAEMFRHQTVRALADAAAPAGAEAPSLEAAETLEPFALLDPEARRALPDDVEDAYPASQVQLAMLYHTERDPGSLVYLNLNGYRVHTRFDKAAMRQALDRLAARHPVLRTSFDLAAAPEPVQRVHRQVELPLEVADLRHLDADEQNAWFDRERGRGFDWSRAPLMRFHVHLLSDDAFRLVLAEHHALLDGWSVASLMTELLRLYLALRDGTADPTGAPPAACFRDFVALERRAVASPGSRAFWRGVVDDAPVAELPPRQGAAEALDEAPYLWVDLPAETAEGLRRVADGEGVPLKTVLLAAHLRVLALLGGGTDVVTGYVTSGRPEADGGDRALGLFLNTVPLRVRMEGATWRELLRRTWAAEEALLPHRRFPLAEMVNGTGARVPFEAAFNFTHFHVYDALGADGVRLEGDRFFQKTELPLTANASVDPATGTLRLRLEYDPALLGQAQVRAAGGWYARALAALAGGPDARWDADGLLDGEEAARLARLSAGPPAEDAFLPLHERFAAQARRTPEAAAVRMEGATLTYAQLDARANRVARHLRGLGVGPEVRVGIHLERGPELAAALLGVLKAGGAYVPLDPAYPAERLGFMLADSGLAVLLTRGGADALAVPDGVHVVDLDAARARIDAERAEPVESGVHPRALAYVLYTSGSTGRPKGVAVEHAGLSSYLAWAARTYPGGGSVVHSSLSFDLTVTSLFVPLMCGGCVEMVAETDAVERLARRLEEPGRIGMLKLTPTHLRALGELLDRGAAGGGAECLVVGGEALLGEQLEFWSRRFPDTTLVNEYGPTETVVGCCIDVRALRDAGAGRIPIGRPVPGMRLYVLDAAGRPVPAGVPGEMYIGGAQVTRGYLGRPGLTAERFLPDPSAEPGARMYRTGDRVVWTESSAEVRECVSADADQASASSRTDALTHSRTGVLDYLGRLDEQVKVRGHRIELGEVEAVLAAHPAVRGCAVLLREDVPGDPRLVAYAAGEADAGELRAHLRRALPEHMVPAAVVVLDALPLTPNGKLDRRALPAPEYAESAGEAAAPRTPVEEVLAGIWGQVLRRDAVGIHQGFFELGGHSLLAMRVVSRVREAFAVELPLRALFEDPTVAGLAARVEALRRAGAGPLPPVAPAPRDRALPLSFAQERLWFLDRVEPGTPLYNVPAATRLHGELDAGALERALQALVRRHETLRTRFPESAGSPVQAVAPVGPFALEVEDLSGLDPAAREAEAARRAAADAAQPFDLAAGPLFRARLLRLGAREHVLLICLHHAVSDGWSMGVLFRELSALYAAEREGTEPALADLPVQYADYAAWQREQLRGDEMERLLAYWRQQLSGAPALLELPVDHPRPVVRSHAGAVERMELPGALLERLHALGRREGATLYMVLLAAFQVLLARYAGSDDVVVGSPSAGRGRGETEGLIGFFVNTLVLRTDLSGDPAFHEVLRRVRAVTLGAYEHQDAPFERLVEELQPERSLGHSPLFQVMFSLDDGDAAAPAFPGVRAEAVGVETATAKFDLALGMSRGEGGLRAAIAYSTALFEAPTIRAMLRHLQRVLEQVADDAALRPSDLQLLDGGERARVLRAWNDTEPAFPGDPVHRLVAEYARRAPESVAVLHEGDALSYGELDRRAEAVARRLRALG